ncbi:MAG: putative porin, partial [Bacteroidales bacterium]|nr:putative porin [Bacteroidales bacterium]
WNFDYKINSHKFINESGTQGEDFFPNTYLNAAGTNEFNRSWHLRNTLGISLLEGFNKYAKFGFAVYAQHEIRRYTQVADSISGLATLPEGLDALPCNVPHRTTENLMYVGGQLTKQHGSILTYDAMAKFGVLGDVAGDVEANGDVKTRLHLFGDTVTIRGYGYFKNTEAPYLMKHFISNHYAWSNDFSKETRFRVGGELNIPFSGTNVNVGYETLKNYLYFGENGTPAQCSSPIHVLSATLRQHLRFGILTWDNELTYQTSSNEQVLPLPKFAVYSNLFIKFTVAKVLKVQLGADGNYYTSYYAPAYNPALMNFHNQSEVKCGNFAFVNVYANFRMKQARFYVSYTHANKGLFGGDNYFSTPHYPLNPARFQFGVSVNFVN